MTELYDLYQLEKDSKTGEIKSQFISEELDMSKLQIDMENLIAHMNAGEFDDQWIIEKKGSKIEFISSEMGKSVPWYVAIPTGEEL